MIFNFNIATMSGTEVSRIINSGNDKSAWSVQVVGADLAGTLDGLFTVYESDDQVNWHKLQEVTLDAAGKSEIVEKSFNASIYKKLRLQKVGLTSGTVKIVYNGFSRGQS